MNFHDFYTGTAFGTRNSQLISSSWSGSRILFTF